MEPVKKQKTILIVDDIAGNIDVLVGILQSDYRLKVATNGKNALEVANSVDKPDLILLDIMMPEMDGYAVCRELKKSAKTRRIPVIFVTAKGEIKDEEKGLKLGAVDYLTKPVSPPIVRARVKNHMELAQAKLSLETSLEKTLLGSIRILTEVLAISNPDAFSRALRLKEMITELARKMDIRPAWKYEVAASLSQLGCIFLPPELMKKIQSKEKLSEKEMELYRSYPEKTYKLLLNIPHLEESANMIRQLKLFEDAALFDIHSDEAVSNVLLQGVIYFDEQVSLGKDPDEVLAYMKGFFPAPMSDSLSEVEANLSRASDRIKLSDLAAGMVLAEDVMSDSGSILISRGTRLTEALVLRLKNKWNGRLEDELCVSL